MNLIKSLPSITHHYQRTSVQINGFKISRRVTYIVGENGRGKSTYLKVLAGVIHSDHLKIKTQFRFLAEHVIFPAYITAKTYLNEMIRIDQDASEINCQKWVDILGFNKYMHYEINQLSKGNKQKLNLIQVLMCDVPLFLLDEPFSGLDKNTVFALSKSLYQSGKQYIITTHIKHVYENNQSEVITL